jgi:outer membrane protein assembly factor BamB
MPTVPTGRSVSTNNDPHHLTAIDLNTPNAMPRTSTLRYSVLFMLLVPTLLWAQKEFPMVWEGKFSVDPRWNAVSPDLAYVVAGDMEEIEMLDGTTGKALWKYNFKEKHGVKQCEDWIAHHDTETIEVITQKDKNAPREVNYLDYRTGQVVAESQLAARNRDRGTLKRSGFVPKRINKTEVFDAASATIIKLSYDDKKIKSAMGGTNLNIIVQANGGNSWTSNFTGKVVAHMIYDMLPADDGEVILDVSVGHDRVFVVYEGITCLDLGTGKVLWSTTFDNTETSLGLKAKQVIGRAAMPLPAADGVYVCDFSKGERAIKKLDLSTGTVIWTADKLGNDDIVSELVLEGGNLIARFGGLVRNEIFIPSPNGGVGDGTYKVEYTLEGSTSLRAYDAGTGAAKWNTEAMELPDNFKKSECSILNKGGRIYACGEKNLYVFDPATGKVEQQAEYSSKVIGKARWLYAFGDAFMIEGEKGIAQMDSSMKLSYATNTGQCLLTEMRGDAFIVWTGKKADDRNEFIRLDPATGAILGKLEGCYRPRFDLSGDRFVRFDNPKVMLYRTN